MSNRTKQTYVGPFGRVLPVPEDGDPEQHLGPIDETRSTMAAPYTLPRPALDFGSDNRGFTDPLRYSSQKPLPPPTRYSPTEQPGIVRNESLPGVRQLLTPANHSTSPFSSIPSSVPQQRPSLPSGPSQTVELPSPDAGYSSQGNYLQSQPTNLNNFAQKPTPLRDNYVDTSGPLNPAYISNTAPNPTPYSTHVGQPSQVAYPTQSQASQVAPGGYPSQIQPQLPVYSMAHLPQQDFPQVVPLQYFADTHGNYPSLSTNQSGSPEQSGRRGSAENAVKLQPRVVRDAVLPGEGPVWIYEDGSTCPKVIDGETVNAQWGVTKAGKPRKRLAIACTTCREKKIKCDPKMPKCAQCEKFGRECHYATAPRVQHTSPESPSYEFQAHGKSITVKTETINRVLLPFINKDSQSKDHLVFKQRKSSPELSQALHPSAQSGQRHCKKPPSKKKPTAVTPPSSGANRCQTSPKEQFQHHEASTINAMKAPWEEEPSVLPLVRFDWTVNPYDIDAGATIHYIEAYLTHINAGTHHMFPSEPLMSWVEDRSVKSQNDMMLIYSMLALGSLFSTRHDCNSHSRLFLKIARYAVENSQHECSLQLSQSRILLALYHFATGKPQIGWDFAGQGLRAAAGLKLNLEEKCGEIQDVVIPYCGLTWHALIECRRRTYWSAYIIDRFGGFHSGHMSMLQDKDTFLRLPCNEETYSRQEPTDAPFFNNGLIDHELCRTRQPSTLGPMAYIVELSSIWGDVLQYTYRHSRQPIGEYASKYEVFHRKTSVRLHQWKSSLPNYLEYSVANTARSLESGGFACFIEIHTLYHATISKLNRNFRHADMPYLSSSRNFLKARKQAVELLQMMEVIDTYRRSATNAMETSAKFPDLARPRSPLAGTTPFAGYAILFAIDILTAGGRVDPEPFQTLIKSLAAGLAIVDELGQCWASAIGQKMTILRRVEALCTKATSEEVVVKKVWRCRQALDKGLHAGQDVFYPDAEAGMDNFFENLGIDVKEHEILHID